MADLTITISPVRELAKSVTEEWPSASGGCPLGLLAGLLPLEIKQIMMTWKDNSIHMCREAN